MLVGSNPTPSARPRKTGSDLGLCRWSHVAGSLPTAAGCSRLPPIVAGRGIYAGWVLMCFPGQPAENRRVPATRRRLRRRWPGDKAAPAAPLARRQRRALPWEARPAHAGPHSAGEQIKMAHTAHRPGTSHGRVAAPDRAARSDRVTAPRPSPRSSGRYPRPYAPQIRDKRLWAAYRKETTVPIAPERTGVPS